MSSLSLYAWDELIDAEFPHGKFLIDPYIPVGSIVFLFGPKSVGKSALQWSWARAISRGEPWLGLPVRKGRVLLIEVDQPVSSIQTRVQAVGRTSGVWVLAGNPITIPNLAPNAWDAVKRARDLAEPDLVVFNTLHTVTSLPMADEHTVREVYGWGRDVFPGSALLFMHHPKKEPPSNVFVDQNEMFAGANPWRNDAQTSLQLQKWVFGKKGKKGKKARIISTARLRHTGSQVSPLYKALPLYLDKGVHWSSYLVDDLTRLKEFATSTGLTGTDLDREAFKCGILGSLSTARSRRKRLELGFPGSREWLLIEDGEDGDDDRRDEHEADDEHDREDGDS